MIKRKLNGQFAKGSHPVAGFEKREMKGSNHPMWKGGLPKCLVCNKILSRRGAKNCQKHSFTPERIEKIKAGALKRSGDRHPNWKGIKASYRAKHNWIVKRMGQPTKCDFCGKDKLTGHKIHWANISGKYKRIINDWTRLCTKCHGAFDKKRRKQSLKI